MLLVMGFLSHTSPFPKGPILQMVLSKVKIKTRKINTLSKKKNKKTPNKPKELTLSPLNKSA